MATRSTQLFVAHRDLSENAMVYRVPPNETVILKSIYFEAPGGSDTTLILQIDQAGHIGAFYVDLVVTTLSTTRIGRWDGWVVLEQADEIWMYNSAAPVNAWGSGALLPGSA